MKTQKKVGVGQNNFCFLLPIFPSSRLFCAFGALMCLRRLKSKVNFSTRALATDMQQKSGVQEGGQRTCTQRKGRERKSRNTVQRINKLRLEHLWKGGSRGAHLLRGGSKENNSRHLKSHKTALERKWFSSRAVPADRKPNPSSYDH